MPVAEHLLPFSAHNIELSDGQRTVPAKAQLLNEQGRMTATLRTLELIAPRGERLRIVDLGCLEGGYSIEFARLGHDVVGIDARQINIDRARAVKDDLGLGNVEFAVDDVKHLADYGQFDAVFCSGLLYHLDQPRHFLELLGEVATRVLVLDTHFARVVEPADAGVAGNAGVARTDFGLSELTEHEGLVGRWYPEYEIDEPRENVEARLWAAFSNDRSFWPTKRSLLGACRDAGFDVIYQQYDVVDDIAADTTPQRDDRAMFTCIKLPLPAPPPTAVQRLVGRGRDIVRSVRRRLPSGS